MYNLAEKERILNPHAKSMLLRCRDALSLDYPDARIILYGSQARGQAGPDSDIDLLLLLDKPVSAEQKRRIHDLLYEIALAEDLVVSVIIKSTHKWNLPICRATPLYQIIQKEGIKVT